jgi:Uma2 family endonuclease
LGQRAALSHPSQPEAAGLIRPKRDEVEYPESDGKPMAETDVHRDLMAQLIDALKWRYRDDPQIYISGNLLLYYVEGDPTKSKAPDVFVVKGVEKRLRRIYKLWEEGVAPSAVIELTSKSTRREDQKGKFELYANWGVREYFLFDPLNEYLRPPLQGFRLRRGHYEVIKADELGRLESKELGVWLERDGTRLRLWDVTTGEEALDGAERAQAAVRRAVIAESRAQFEAAARQAEAAARRAEAERAAEAESRAAAAEAELAKLRSQLARGKKRRR